MMAGPSSDRTNPALVRARLRALARAVSGSDLSLVDTTIGAGLAGDVAFYLAENDPRAVGRALHWAQSRRASRLEILATGASGDLARRAGLLLEQPGPTIRVWSVIGAEVNPAVATSIPEPPELPASHWALAGLITEAGARPVDDNGRLVAEVAGLEVARVVEAAPVHQPTTEQEAAGDAGGGTEPAAGPTIEVGVGQADRELNALVHSGHGLDRDLRRVVATVVQHRASHGSSHHPLNRLARERWLRTLLLDRPELIEAVELAPLVPLRPRRGLVRSEPSAAYGRLRSGRPVVAVSMVGIDLDLVPEAADYRQRSNPEAAVVLVLPERDLRLSTRLLGRLPDATAVSLPTPWVS
jgi:hypothetical protein